MRGSKALCPLSNLTSLLTSDLGGVGPVDIFLGLMYWVLGDLICTSPGKNAALQFPLQMTFGEIPFCYPIRLSRAHYLPRGYRTISVPVWRYIMHSEPLSVVTYALRLFHDFQ